MEHSEGQKMSIKSTLNVYTSSVNGWSVNSICDAEQFLNISGCLTLGKQPELRGLFNYVFGREDLQFCVPVQGTKESNMMLRELKVLCSLRSLKTKT